MVLKLDEESKNYKVEFDFGKEANPDAGEIVDLGEQTPLGCCPKCKANVVELGKSYVCEKSVPTASQPVPSCDFKSGQMILQQPIEREQMVKLLSEGKTDVLDKFVSMRTRRPFKARLAWDAAAGKVNFAFEASKFPPRKTASVASGPPGAKKAFFQASKVPASKQTPARAATKTIAKKKAVTKDPAAKKAAAKKVPRTAAPGSGLQPNAALAAVIGSASALRTEIIKKLWDYIKANGLQDATDRRAINADAKLLPVFGGKAQITMFELAGIVGKNVESKVVTGEG